MPLPHRRVPPGAPRRALPPASACAGRAWACPPARWCPLVGPPPRRAEPPRHPAELRRTPADQAPLRAKELPPGRPAAARPPHACHFHRATAPVSYLFSICPINSLQFWKMFIDNFVVNCYLHAIEDPRCAAPSRLPCTGLPLWCHADRRRLAAPPCPNSGAAAPTRVLSLR